MKHDTLVYTADDVESIKSYPLFKRVSQRGQPLPYCRGNQKEDLIAWCLEEAHKKHPEMDVVFLMILYHDKKKVENNYLKQIHAFKFALFHNHVFLKANTFNKSTSIKLFDRMLRARAAKWVIRQRSWPAFFIKEKRLHPEIPKNGSRKKSDSKNSSATS